MRALLPLFAFPVASLSLLAPAVAFADTGAPPPDQKALVAAPTPVAAPPKIDSKANDSTTATVSAGGQLATGNSRLLAMTANGKFDMRRGANGFGAAFIGNYGQSAAPAAAGTPSDSTPLTTSTENFQGRLRYDRYVLDDMSLFLIGTVRHDKFQGLDGRVNIDPGLKYLFVQSDATGFWAELGYDFQYDARNGNPAPTSDGTPTGIPLSLTATSHSARAFVGFKHAFNAAVTLVTGLEYLQSLASSDSDAVLPGASTDSRVNFDALFAANVGAGFSLGLGFSARYDRVPLPNKQQTDTITTFNLIYAFSDIAAPPPPPTCPCPEPVPPPPPAAPATTTTTTTTATPAATPAATPTPTTTTTTTTTTTPATPPPATPNP